MVRALDQAARNSAESTGAVLEGGFNALVPEIDVSDIQQSIVFWRDMLGFSIAYDRPAAKFAYLQREGAQIMLCEINGNWQTGAYEYPLGRGINFQIGVSDIGPVLARLQQAGWPLYREPATARYKVGDQERGSVEFLVQDPDGYLVRISQSVGLPDAHHEASPDAI